MGDNAQMGLSGFLDDSEDKYIAFTEKFKAKKTTDDCYTPAPVFDAVLDYVCKRYGIPQDRIHRPFYPGWDYENFDYQPGFTVVDNPPFSILSAIIDFYNANDIPYFLFAPYLTNFNYGHRCTHIVTDVCVTYENGAEVPTSFVSNLEPDVLVRSAPDLQAALEKANALGKVRKELPKYKYPDHVLTASMVGAMSKRGVQFELRKQDAMSIRALDSQKSIGKTIFGAGFLLSSSAAAAAAAAEKYEWALSQREIDLIAWLDGKKQGVRSCNISINVL